MRLDLTCCIQLRPHLRFGRTEVFSPSWHPTFPKPAVHAGGECRRAGQRHDPEPGLHGPRRRAYGTAGTRHDISWVNFFAESPLTRAWPRNLGWGLAYHIARSASSARDCGLGRLPPVSLITPEVVTDEGELEDDPDRGRQDKRETVRVTQRILKGHLPEHPCAQPMMLSSYVWDEGAELLRHVPPRQPPQGRFSARDRHPARHSLFAADGPGSRLRPVRISAVPCLVASPFA